MLGRNPKGGLPLIVVFGVLAVFYLGLIVSRLDEGLFSNTRNFQLVPMFALTLAIEMFLVFNYAKTKREKSGKESGGDSSMSMFVNPGESPDDEAGGKPNEKEH